MQLGPVRARSTYYVERMQDTLAACAWWGDVAIRARLLRPHLRRAAGPPHLALLAWYFPPSVTGGTYRPTSLSRRCAEFGWRVSVIAGPGHRRPERGRHLPAAELARGCQDPPGEPSGHRSEPAMRAGHRRGLREHAGDCVPRPPGLS